MIAMLYLLQDTFKRVESYKRYICGHIYGMYMLYICVSRPRHLEIQWVEHSTKGYRLEDERQGIYRYNGGMVGIDSTGHEPVAECGHKKGGAKAAYPRCVGERE